MRDITKILSVPAEGKPADFRLTKPGVFLVAVLPLMLSRRPEGSAAADLLTVLAFSV